MPYDDSVPSRSSIDDFKRLWATNFLDNLSIEVARLHVLERRRSARSSSTTWRSGSASRSSTTSASKKVDAVEDRREAEGEATRRSASTRSSIPALVRKVDGIVRDMMPRRATSSPRSRPRSRRSRAARSWCNVTFHITEGPKVKIRDDRVRRQQGDQRRHARAADEGEQGRRHASRSSPAAAPTRKTSSTRTPRRCIEYYRDQRLHRARSVGQPELKIARGLEGRQDALGRAADPGHRRAALQGRRVRVRPATRSSRPKACGRCSSSNRARLLQREDDPQGLREGAGGLRRRRLLGVHRLSRSASRATSRTRADAGRRRTRLQAPRARRRRHRDGPADRRRDDADAGRASSTSSTASPSSATRRRATT